MTEEALAYWGLSRQKQTKFEKKENVLYEKCKIDTGGLCFQQCVCWWL
jgi:hypothetical protein